MENILFCIEAHDLFCAGRNGLYYQELIQQQYKDKYNIDIVLCCVIEDLYGHQHYPGGYGTLDIRLVHHNHIHNEINCDNYDYIIYLTEKVILWGDFISQLLSPLENDFSISVPKQTFERYNECVWCFKSSVLKNYLSDIYTIKNGFYSDDCMMKKILDNGNKIIGVDDISLINYAKQN